MARPRVGFIGTGLIGTPMVQRLLECGLSVTVWNRTPDKATPLVRDGASLAESPRALAESCQTPAHAADPRAVMSAEEVAQRIQALTHLPGALLLALARGPSLESARSRPRPRRSKL